MVAQAWKTMECDESMQSVSRTTPSECEEEEVFVEMECLHLLLHISIVQTYTLPILPIKVNWISQMMNTSSYASSLHVICLWLSLISAC